MNQYRPWLLVAQRVFQALRTRQSGVIAITDWLQGSEGLHLVLPVRLPASCGVAMLASFYGLFTLLFRYSLYAPPPPPPPPVLFQF